MGVISDTADEVYRDYVTPGVPSSGANKPDKAAIRALFALVEEEVVAMGDSWDHVEVPADSTDAPLQTSGGGIGSRLFLLLCKPTNTTIGEISYKDGSEGAAVVLHPAKERVNDDPFQISVRFESKVGTIYLSVGAACDVIAVGTF
jgi:hypothetical protein